MRRARSATSPLRRLTILGVAVAFGVLTWGVTAPQAGGQREGAPGVKALYVAQDGEDTNPGTFERPFASLPRARDALRAWKEERGLPERGITVYLRRGTYPLLSTFELDERDSGVEGRPVTYRAYRGEQVRLIGGVEVPATAFGPVEKTPLSSRVSPQRPRNTSWRWI